MGRLGSGLTFPVSFLVLAWAAGSGSVQVLHRPTCFSDYISTSTCEWRVDRPANCSAELRLTYQLDFPNSKNHTCIPENIESTLCLCDMLMDDMVESDTYQLDLWAGKQLLWSGSFQPGEHVKPRAPVNLTVEAVVPRLWQLCWDNPYPPESYLHRELSYQVIVSDEEDPASYTVHNVTYREPTLHLPASTLKPGASYRAQVRARAQSYNSTWSEWSPGVTWLNHYTSWEQHLPLGVLIACMVILVICVSCYFSIINPTHCVPALSSLLAVLRTHRASSLRAFAVSAPYRRALSQAPPRTLLIHLQLPLRGHLCREALPGHTLHSSLFPSLLLFMALSGVSCVHSVSVCLPLLEGRFCEGKAFVCLVHCCVPEAWHGEWYIVGAQ